MKTLTIMRLSFLICMALIAGCKTNNQDNETSLNRTDDGLSQDSSTDVKLMVGTEELILETLRSGSYRQSGFDKVNQTSFHTSLNGEQLIDLYISDFSTERYQRIDPNEEGSLADVPPSTLIIREVWNPDNTLDKYTVMMKQSPGYFPEGGDFFYGVVDTEGNFLKKGALQDCASCHKPRETDGFLFGVDPLYHQDVSSLPSQPSNFQIVTTERLMNKARVALTYYQYLSDNFYQVAETFDSTLNSKDKIKVYASKFAAEIYQNINLDDKGSMARIPEESVIIREVLDENDVTQKFTVMVKGPKGYFPEGGDFFYGVYDAFMEPVIKDSGDMQIGALKECAACHISRPLDGYMYGLPNAAVKTIIESF